MIISTENIFLGNDIAILKVADRKDWHKVNPALQKDWYALSNLFPAVSVSDSFREKNAKYGASNSRHKIGLAIDIVGSTSQLDNVAYYLAGKIGISNYKKGTSISYNASNQPDALKNYQLLWRVKGHYNHVHFGSNGISLLNKSVIPQITSKNITQNVAGTTSFALPAIAISAGVLISLLLLK